MDIWARNSPGRGNSARSRGRSTASAQGTVKKPSTMKGERTGEEMISSERYKELCGKAPPIISGTQQVLST